MKNTIRQIYFYAATLIFLIMSTVAAISLLNLGLKTYVLTKADLTYNSCSAQYPAAPIAKPVPAPGEAAGQQPTKEELDAQRAQCEKDQAEQRDAQRQNSLAQYIAMLVVSAPLFWLHFKWVQKERETELALAKDEKKA